jgi:iron complex outermembrane receptor protein
VKSTDEFQAKSITTFGSFGLLKQNFSAIMVNPPLGSVNYSHLQSDFRQNSSYDRKSLTLQNKQINSRRIILYRIYTQLKAYIPSSINEAILTIILKTASNWAGARL